MLLTLAVNLLLVSSTLAANFLPVSTTPAVPVAKFAAIVVDTVGKYWRQIYAGVVDTGGAP